MKRKIQCRHEQLMDWEDKSRLIKKLAMEMRKAVETEHKDRKINGKLTEEIRKAVETEQTNLVPP